MWTPHLAVEKPAEILKVSSSKAESIGKLYYITLVNWHIVLFRISQLACCIVQIFFGAWGVIHPMWNPRLAFEILKKSISEEVNFCEEINFWRNSQSQLVNRRVNSSVNVWNFKNSSIVVWVFVYSSVDEWSLKHSQSQFVNRRVNWKVVLNSSMQIFVSRLRCDTSNVKREGGLGGRLIRVSWFCSSFSKIFFPAWGVMYRMWNPRLAFKFLKK